MGSQSNSNSVFQHYAFPIISSTTCGRKDWAGSGLALYKANSMWHFWFSDDFQLAFLLLSQLKLPLLFSSQQQWRHRMRPVKMVRSWLALSLHVVPRIVWVLQPCDTKRLNEELLGSELWLHCALPLLCCLSSKLSYRFLSAVTGRVLKDSFPTFLTSLRTFSPGTGTFGLVLLHHGGF